MEQVQQLGIDRVDVTGAEVPQEVVDGLQGLRQICSSPEVFDREPFAGVRVREMQGTDRGGEGQQAVRRGQYRGCSLQERAPGIDEHRTFGLSAA